MVALRDRSRIRSPEADLLELSESDLEVLNEVWNEFGHWDRWALVRYTHSNSCPEWEDPEGSSTPIPHEVLFLKPGYSSEQSAALAERLRSQSSLNKSFCREGDQTVAVWRNEPGATLLVPSGSRGLLDPARVQTLVPGVG
jgi:hypothetical protein